MPDHVRPDDVARSPSGRVPKWVLDEARGLEPNVVPFRGPTSSGGPRKKPGRVKRWTKVTASVLLIGGAAWFLNGLSQHQQDSMQALTNTSGPRTQPLPGHEEKRHPLGAPAALASTSSSFRFLGHQLNSKAPITWSPCRPIHYVVRPDNEPPQGQQLLQQAFARLHLATGLVFVDDGTTSEAPSEDRESYQRSRYGERWAPVLVTWATQHEVPDFGVDIAGEAGPVGLDTPSGDRAYVSGTVSFDAAWFRKELASNQSGQARAIVLHELGHLVGLAHVDDASQIMFPRAGSARLDYGAGDLAGLAKLGTGHCQSDI